MISYTSTSWYQGRQRGTREETCSTGYAFGWLVAIELVHGGVIVSVTPTEIEVQTRIPEGYSYSSLFIGGEEEMKPLVEMAQHFTDPEYAETDYDTLLDHRPQLVLNYICGVAGIDPMSENDWYDVLLLAVNHLDAGGKLKDLVIT